MPNYSKQDLERIAKETGFIRDNLEKVLRLCNILQYLNTNPAFTESVALKGGTAINLTVFDLPRLSIDIDLDFTRSCTREEMLAFREEINRDLVNYMFAQGYSLSPNTKNPHSLDSWVYYFQNAGGNKDNIKIEINYSMRNHILPIEKKHISTGILQPDFEVRTLSTLELFGSKIKALIERTAARDLYDVHNMINHGIISSDRQDFLRRIILFYLAVGGKNKPKITFDLQSIDNLKFSQIRASLIPVLRKSEHFDFEKAKLEVKGYLSNLMVLTDDEKSFVENFNQGNYRPELLFEGAAILDRIKEHPMAIWKMKQE